MRWLATLAIVALGLSSDCYSDTSKYGGELIPAAAVRQKITTAYVSNGQEWCTPAMQVGPRTFLTAAHCIPVLQGSSMIRLSGAGIDESVAFRSIFTGPVLSDDTAFSAPACKALFDTIRDGDILSLDQMRTCWANDGQWDAALLVTDAPVNGGMLSISAKPIENHDILGLLGYAPGCGGNEGFYRYAFFHSFGFIHSQVVLDGAGAPGGDTSSCPGDSGGLYLRRTEKGVEISAVNSGGTNEDHLNVTAYGKSVVVPAHFAGGTNLSSPKAQRWFRDMIRTYNLEICGMNLTCPLQEGPAGQ